MGKKQESFEAVLGRMKENGPLMMREQLKLLTSAAVEGTGEKVSRDALLAAAHMVSKEATKTAMAWSGEVDQEDALLLLNVLLQAVSAFVTVCHGFTAGAGPTLLAAIRAAATAVVEASAQLMEGCINLVQQGATNEDKASVLPKLAGRVWETCESVKKAPTSNQVAVGRGLALLATTVKDTLREMGEMKETASGEGGKSESHEGESAARVRRDERIGGEGLLGEGAKEGAKETGEIRGVPEADGAGLASSREGVSGAVVGKQSEGSDCLRAQADEAASALTDGLQQMHLTESNGRDALAGQNRRNGTFSHEDGPKVSSTKGEKEEAGQDQIDSRQGTASAGEESATSSAQRGSISSRGEKQEESGGVGKAGTTQERPQASGSLEGGREKQQDAGGAVTLPEDLGDVAEILDYNPEFDAEDMELVRAAVAVAENVLALLKQLLYVVAKWAPPADWSQDAALNVLEMLHGDCSDICLQVEELGACLYPPQEIESILQRTATILEKANNVDDILHEAVEGGPSAGCQEAVAAVMQACQEMQQLIAEGTGADDEDE